METMKSMEEFERAKRWPARDMAELVLTRQDREELLLEWGATVHEIIEAIRATVKTKQQRRRTVTAIGTYDRLEEVMEQASRRIKRTLKLQRTDPWEYNSSTNNQHQHQYHPTIGPTNKASVDTPPTMPQRDHSDRSVDADSIHEVTDFSVARSSPRSFRSLDELNDQEAAPQQPKQTSVSSHQQTGRAAHKTATRRPETSTAEVVDPPSRERSDASTASSLDTSTKEERNRNDASRKKFTDMVYKHDEYEEYAPDDATLPSGAESAAYNDDYDLEFDPRYKSFEFAKDVVMNVVEHAVSNDSNHEETYKREFEQQYNDQYKHEDEDEPYYGLNYDPDFDEDFLPNDISEMSASTFISQFTSSDYLNASRHSVGTEKTEDQYEALIRCHNGYHTYWELCPGQQDAPVFQQQPYNNAVIICEDESDIDQAEAKPHVSGHFSGTVPVPPPEFMHHLQQMHSIGHADHDNDPLPSRQHQHHRASSHVPNLHLPARTSPPPPPPPPSPTDYNIVEGREWNEQPAMSCRGHHQYRSASMVIDKWN
jgi:hypothetical protein